MSQKIELPKPQIHLPMVSIIEQMVMRIIERELASTQEMAVMPEQSDEEIDAFERSFIWQNAVLGD